MEFGAITALLIFTIYILVVVLLWRTGLLQRFNIGAAGPLLMLRTRRGLSALDRFARRGRFWKAYGNLSMALVLFFMGLVTLILIWEVPLALQVPASSAPGPEYIIGIPGLNPLIPIGYGILGLAIAILVHETAHGILTRVAGVTVKSSGLLLLVVPIGAFVEPDEEQLKKLDRRRRIRMYSAGPATNLLLALLCAVIFSWGFMSSVEPVQHGVVITSISADYPADNASIPTWSLITEIGLPNASAPVKIESAGDFTSTMANTSAGDNITITYIYRGEERTKNVTLADKYEYYQKYYPRSDNTDYMGKGFLGVGTMDVSDLSRALARPMKFDSLQNFTGGLVSFIGLPFLRLQPLDSPVTDLYHVSGPLGSLPPGLFWVLANSFYWIFWLNLVVGASNSLPIPRFDGGMVYLDCWEALLARIRPGWTIEKRAHRALWIYRATGLVILFLVLWQIIGPRVGGLL